MTTNHPIDQTLNLGVWGQFGYDYPCDPTLPADANWIVCDRPTYPETPAKVSRILSWFMEHPSDKTFTTNEDLQKVMDDYNSADLTGFWGVIFLGEEHYRKHITFDSSVNIDFWSSECRLLSYEEYSKNNAGTVEDWKTEMLYRMVKGFLIYCRTKGVKAGITLGGWSTIDPIHYGEKVLQFINENYDFAVGYVYTQDLNEFHTLTLKVYNEILKFKGTIFWIITQRWATYSPNWQRETIALETKRAMSYGFIILTYYLTETGSRTFNEMWSDIRTCINLYESKQPYFEVIVSGKNLLTEAEGKTYGYVCGAVPPPSSPSSSDRSL